MAATNPCMVYNIGSGIPICKVLVYKPMPEERGGYNVVE